MFHCTDIRYGRTSLDEGIYIYVFQNELGEKRWVFQEDCRLGKTWKYIDEEVPNIVKQLYEIMIQRGSYILRRELDIDDQWILYGPHLARKQDRVYTIAHYSKDPFDIDYEDIEEPTRDPIPSCYEILTQGNHMKN